MSVSLFVMTDPIVNLMKADIFVSASRNLLTHRMIIDNEYLINNSYLFTIMTTLTLNCFMQCITFIDMRKYIM